MILIFRSSLQLKQLNNERLILKILHKIQSIFEHKAIVLMYHRIAEPLSDVWRIAVSKKNFEAHLNFFKSSGSVMPLAELVDDFNKGRMRKNAIAISFDDGYIDNYLTAKPLLQQYDLPATFFISSGNIETANEFWWDELENIFLLSESLPPYFSMVISEQIITADLSNETTLTTEIRDKHAAWNACVQQPPTNRARLFYDMWSKLRPLLYVQQQILLNAIKEWTKVDYTMREDYKTMSKKQLMELSGNRLFSIGAHTGNHPALAAHILTYQKKEMMENKKFLEVATGNSVTLLAYPYGNYNSNTMLVARELGFTGAFTTEEHTIKSNSNNYSFGRFQVNDVNVEQVEQSLKHWRKY